MSALKPDTDDTHDLGSSALRWRNLYVHDIDIATNIATAGSFVFEGSANAHETTFGVVDPTADAIINLPAMSADPGTYYLPVLAAASTTAITATPEELNLLDATAGVELALATGDALIIGDASDSNATKKVLMSDVITLLSNTTFTFTNLHPVTIQDATAASSDTTGALIVTGGISTAADLFVGDDLVLVSDNAELVFGADKEVKLVHNDILGGLILTNNGETASPVFELRNTNADATGSTLKFNKDGASVDDGDVVGNIDFTSEDDGSNEQVYARINSTIDDKSSGAEQGGLDLYVAANDGTLAAGLQIQGTTSAGVVDVTVGLGAASTVTIPGNLTVSGTTTTVDTVTMQAANAVVFEGATADAHETFLRIVDPTNDDNDIYLPDASGYVPLISDASAVDGAVTAAEFALLDGDTARGTTAVADGDGIFTNSNGTMRHTTVQTFQTYFDENSAGGTNIVTVGNLNAGSITSGFTSINVGAGAISTTGLGTFGSLDVDNVLIDGSNIGFTGDPDLLTLAVGALTLNGGLTVGSPGTGHDVTLYGSASGAYLEWDEDQDELEVRGPAGSHGTLLLSTAETSVVDGDKLGQISFQAPSEAEGSDGALVSAAIWAEADGTFDATSNVTDIVFATGTDGAVEERMRLDNDGNLNVVGTLTCATSLTIGSAAMAEADLEKLDGITNGTAAINKALVLGGSSQIAGIGTIGCGAITATGTSSFAGGITPAEAGEADLGSAAKEWRDLYLKDAGVIKFGADQDITLTHVADSGLTITNTTAGTDNAPVVLQLKSEEDAIVEDNVIASLEFAAGDSDGSDAALVSAGIHAIAEETFAADANATKLVFTAADSETAAASATAKMTLASTGNLSTAGSITATGSFIIGNADMNETDLEKLDGITNGTAALNKALVLGGSSQIAGIGTIGCGAITATGVSSFAGGITPAEAGGAALGSATKEWSSLYLADESIIYMGLNQNVQLHHQTAGGLVLQNASGTSGKPDFTILNTDGDANPASLTIEKKGSSPEAGNKIGEVVFKQENSAGTPENIEYAKIVSVSDNVTDGSEAGGLDFIVKAGGSDYAAVALEKNSGNNGVNITLGADTGNDIVDFKADVTTSASITGASDASNVLYWGGGIRYVPKSSTSQTLNRFDHVIFVTATSVALTLPDATSGVIAGHQYIITSSQNDTTITADSGQSIFDSDGTDLTGASSDDLTLTQNAAYKIIAINGNWYRL